MILVDVNILLYAEDTTSVHHDCIRPWWDALLSGNDPVAFCWPVVMGFLRIATNPKALLNPLSTTEACAKVNEWLAQPYVSLLAPTSRHWVTFQNLVAQSSMIGNLIPDAHLAALAIEHDCELASCDTDFGKFQGLRWINPLTS